MQTGIKKKIYNLKNFISQVFLRRVAIKTLRSRFKISF